MNIALLLTLAALAAATHAAVPTVPTDRMAQFLQEKASLESDLSSWKQSGAGQFAKEHGFVPASSAKVAGGEEDEQLRRFFLAKLLIEDAQATNPEAVFSTDTPFTLMTEDEFTKFVGASYQRGSGLLSDTSSSVEAFTGTTESVSAEKDWTDSGCVVAVKNQGQCGSCWAFAAVASLESAVCLAGRPLTPLSEQQLLDCDEASYACQGGFPGDALNFIQHTGGVCTEEGYPYVSGDTGDRDTCQTSSCTPEAVAIRKVVSVPESETGLLQAISGRPVTVGVAAGNPTWKQYKGGVVSSCTSTDLDHAVLAVGYGGGNGTSPFFKIKNSWGTQWGESGYIRLKRGAGTGSSGTCGIIGPKSVYPQL
uniref:Peptidase C1A papain C-terminal domain-containing protein n=1 Tax=Phytophthora ramorum TaxID=164328 RepID=H3GSN6_PHYRM